MTNENKSRDITTPRGIFSGISNQLKLIVRLMADPRVNPLIKTLPIGSLFYFLLFPDLAPGPLDDALVIWVGTALFVELCPPDIVKEHQETIKHTNPGEGRDKKDGENVIIDTEYKDLD
ncbi:MAG: hypothetical protein Fur0022_31060 [Anaerolineales bacterium]